jgi:VIT1/CCC1 family predicted Fe2+/Mn2+ transporter
VTGKGRPRLALPRTGRALRMRHRVPLTTLPRPVLEVHRSGRGGMLRAGVFGVSDGLMTNMSLILGIAAANASAHVVLLAGVAGMVAGSVSMGAGEYISNRVAGELVARDLQIEREELLTNPEGELLELVAIYRSRGMSQEVAIEAASASMRDPATALLTHAREELGLDGAGPDRMAPYIAGLSSFVAFATGAWLPLVSWFVTRGTAAIIGSVVLGALGAIATAAVSARVTGSQLRSFVVRQLAVILLGTAVTVLIGRLVGVGSLS